MTTTLKPRHPVTLDGFADWRVAVDEYGRWCVSYTRTERGGRIRCKRPMTNSDYRVIRWQPGGPRPTGGELLDNIGTIIGRELTHAEDDALLDMAIS